MNFAFSTNAYRSYSVEESINLIKTAGYNAVEIMCDVPHAFPPISEEKTNSIKKSLSENKMLVSNLNGFMMTAIEDFHHPSWIEESSEYRNKRIQHTKNCLILANSLGAKTVSTEPGGPKTEQGTKKELDLYEEGLKEILPIAEELKVNLLIEPEPELLIERSDQFLSFIDRFDSKFIGLNFDVGHFFCVNEDPSQLILDLKDYIKHVHLEDISSTRKHHHLIPGHGSIDFKKIFEALEKINYDKFVTVELYPYQENPQKAATESIKHLNAILENV